MAMRTRPLWFFLALLSCKTLPEASETPARPMAAAESNRPQDVTSPVPTPKASASEEIGSRKFWVNPSREVARAAARLQSTRPREAAWLQLLAEQPTALWLTARSGNAEMEAALEAQAARASEAYAVFVIQALPKRDCMRYETRGLAPEAYRVWIESLVRAVGETPSYWILEPEALQLTACLTPEELSERQRLIADTVLALKKNPRAQVYIDIGQPAWHSVDAAVAQLLKAGIMTADGFALNVGQYQATADCLAYGQKISEKIGGKSFVVDSSRNGKGPVSRDAWCNPLNRAIGEEPQAPTGIKGLDAYLWLKEPGVSDGPCHGGPAAGVWWEAKAIELMRNAQDTRN